MYLNSETMSGDVVRMHSFNDVVDDESTYYCRIELTSENTKRSKVTTNIDKDLYVNVKAIEFKNSQLSVADMKLIRQTLPNLKAYGFELKRGYEDGEYSHLNNDLLLEFIDIKIIFFGGGIDFSNLNSTVALFNDDMKYVYLQRSKISHLGKFLENWKSLIGFNLNDRSVITEALSPDSFRNNPKLKYLNLCCQDFETFPEGILDNLLDLEYFSYSGSTRTLEIHENLFQKNSKLTEIDLSNNNIQQLDGNLFTNLVNLKKVDLSGNYELKTLPSNLFLSNKNLEELNLKHTETKDLPENLFMGLLNLKVLNLEDCEITELAPNLFRTNIKLETINLSFNKIKQLDGNLFKNLVNLQNVYLNYINELKTLPSNLFLNNKNLEILYLKSYEIRDFPSICIDFHVLSKLKYIYFECFNGSVKDEYEKERYLTKCKCNSID